MTDSAREGRESQFIQFVQSMNEGKAFQSVKLGCFRAAIRCADVNPIDYTGVDLDGSVLLRHMSLTVVETHGPLWPSQKVLRAGPVHHDKSA